jgi:hypothetical protein
MDCWVEVVKTIAEVFTAGGALVGGLWAAYTYHRSVKLERAKWMKELYDKFYENDRLKTIRDQLDGDLPGVISELVQKELSTFTDYLNFFEFLGYLEESGQIKMDEIGGLFDYYLSNLENNPDVKRYIKNPHNGFEKLCNLLAKAAQ